MQDTDKNTPEPLTPNPDPAPLGLIDYLAVIFKYRRMIAGISIAAAIISIVYALLLPNIYTARTLVLPAQEDRGMASAMMSQMGGLASLAIGAGAPLGRPSTADLYVSILKSESVKDPIIDRFKLAEVYRKKYRMDLYEMLDRICSITAGKKDGIITITVSDRDPRRAAAMANAFVEELAMLAIHLNAAGAGENRSFLEERLATAKAELAKAEENLKFFQARNKAVQVTAQAEATIKGVAELRAQLAVQEVQLATLRRQFTDSSQEVKNLVTSVGNLRAQIAKLEGAGENSAIPSVGSVPGIGQEYVRLMREFKIQESLVELLAKQYELTKLSEVRDVSPIQVIQVAKVPERKSKPARRNIVITAVLGGLLFSFLLVFVREYIALMPEENRLRWKELLAFLPIGIKKTSD
ncbi:lipopolysaccharide biosynthesis protein [bacterium]|nr:lipopolysaccharide biosynthesis protein [bacterium]